MRSHINSPVWVGRRSSSRYPALHCGMRGLRENTGYDLPAPQGKGNAVGRP
jgi:hypothetical protein